jgi:hypothetical protein
MIHSLKLTKNEMDLLLGVLESRQRELSHEISNTGALRARAELRKRERAIDRMVERLREEAIPAAAAQGA